MATRRLSAKELAHQLGDLRLLGRAGDHDRRLGLVERRSAHQQTAVATPPIPDQGEAIESRVLLGPGWVGGEGLVDQGQGRLGVGVGRPPHPVAPGHCWLRPARVDLAVQHRPDALPQLVGPTDLLAHLRRPGRLRTDHHDQRFAPLDSVLDLVTPVRGRRNVLEVEPHLQVERLETRLHGLHERRVSPRVRHEHRGAVVVCRLGCSPSDHSAPSRQPQSAEARRGQAAATSRRWNETAAAMTTVAQYVVRVARASTGPRLKSASGS